MLPLPIVESLAMATSLRKHSKMWCPHSLTSRMWSDCMQVWHDDDGGDDDDGDNGDHDGGDTNDDYDHDDGDANDDDGDHDHDDVVEHGDDDRDNLLWWLSS